MSRKKRIWYPGASYHVMSRGNRRTVLFKEKSITTAEKAVKNKSAVISGMAKGIDSYAHTAAIKGNGYTIAVLGSGPDICYPKEHEKLYEDIVKTGCVLSEYPPRNHAKKLLFPHA